MPTLRMLTARLNVCQEQANAIEKILTGHANKIDLVNFYQRRRFLAIQSSKDWKEAIDKLLVLEKDKLQNL